jgi:hypothetical protein
MIPLLGYVSSYISHPPGLYIAVMGLLAVILLPSAALSALPNLFIMDNLGLLEASPVLHVLYGLQLLASIVIGVCVLLVLVHIFRICTAVKRNFTFYVFK